MAQANVTALQYCFSKISTMRAVIGLIGNSEKALLLGDQFRKILADI
jgi:hypothetical protein